MCYSSVRMIRLPDGKLRVVVWCETITGDARDRVRAWRDFSYLEWATMTETERGAQHGAVMDDVLRRLHGAEEISAMDTAPSSSAPVSAASASASGMPTPTP